MSSSSFFGLMTLGDEDQVRTGWGSREWESFFYISETFPMDPGQLGFQLCL